MHVFNVRLNHNKSMRKDYYIPIDEPLNKFNEYLKVNNRCIFSAKFGDGKSCFINEFMERYKDEYLFIPIYPVNYQVADNKDIFEYIKRDILIRLLISDEIDIDSVDVEKSWLLYYYVTNNSTDIALDLLSILPQINLGILRIDPKTIIEKLRNIKNKFQDYEKRFKSDESNAIDNYIKFLEESKGSIYEFDRISQLICNIINRFKEKKTDKRVVLIIEDLDRMDPAHIFRILNIFSAHFNNYNPAFANLEQPFEPNKFNFDKIVTICHYDNLKYIYAHFYGEKADFYGYINKFSDVRPYPYSLKEHLQTYITKRLVETSDQQDQQEYIEIYSIVAEIIVRKYNLGNEENQTSNQQNELYNLRMFNSNFEKYVLVKEELIEISGNDSNSILGTIKSANRFCRLLSLLSLFKINSEELFGAISNKGFSKSLLCKFIDSCWLALNNCDDAKVQFVKNKSQYYCVIPENIKIPCVINKDKDNKTILSLNMRDFLNTENGKYVDVLFEHIDSLEKCFSPYFIIPKDK